MSRLQKDSEANIVHCAKREKELLLRIESELASKAATEKAMESKRKLYEALREEMQRAYDREQESRKRAEEDARKFER
jgi:hypothetical protein